ncbi:hypothetical protein HRR83_004662 [Exophiala dermatitidis]|uniref:Uncharacterized protein n=2 Tax=Exophiala dermatitidis TaxID=5970 RepID=H6BRR5_EXODN|nr:uncharacterized protein HMPREF1120_02194 [Exophiala dermatitidis NIH/UT8656]KAJ4515635.1 hypothetical protein HRR75_003714 [Exophiala dermatitidis]EHY54017.1 hypothetical protein HMPREF1120_02194 [Exophiala dermatitidis NIH/UT8656]KAJ4519316.1 hypothetical protein HRR74_004057 [Exophiala dermatitidis]KAJ4529132.1 hypothetical protein HRR73_000152 [Exophiala dermatitidis]KAJ4538532.1 hypothetical protein HRR77_007015 [Exophiala dermatitidis]
MARILPWNAGADEGHPAKRQRVTQTLRPKAERASSPDTESRATEQETPDVHKAQAPETPERANPTAKRLDPVSRRRSPSSSPVRAPSVSFEPMREGYDADDIYIMVEDEFQTIAQSYTAHLHRAEYKRLVRQAREAAPKALPEPTSPMSKEARHRIKRLALESKQKETLQNVFGTSSKSANAEEEEEEEVVDLWSGTSLAPLMASGGQQKRSLIGLEKITSKTKASMGFARKQPADNAARDEVAGQGEEHRDDLAKGFRQNLPRGRENHVAAGPSSSRLLNSEASRRRHSPAEPRTDDMRSKGNTPSPSSGLDHGSVVSQDRKYDSASRRPRSAARVNRNGLVKRDSEDKEKKSRLEEVPMFII